MKLNFKHAVIKSLTAHLPPLALSSAAVEEKLKPVYQRLKLPFGRLELMSGISERRFWNPGTRPSQVAAEAGKKALALSGFPPEKIGCLIHSSVCRDFMEPATASVVHQILKLPKSCMIFDLSNACLGVLNAIVQLATMVDAQQIEAGLVVSGEVAEPLFNATINNLNNDLSLTRKSFKAQFASLTIGSGAVAVVVSKANNSEKEHKILGGALLTDSNASELCQEDTAGKSEAGPLMATDSEKLLYAGCNLAGATWEEAKAALNWDNNSPDHIFTHQVGVAHQRLLFETTGLNISKDFPTVERFGNTGSAALPTALAIGAAEKGMKKGEKLALLGIGSGLSSLMLGVEW